MRLFIAERNTLADIKAIAEDLGITIYQATDQGVRQAGKFRNKRCIDFMLRPKHGSDKFRKINNAPYGQSGRRRVFAVCWHGHFFFMHKVFTTLDAEAVFKTALSTWDGYHDFMQRAPASGNMQVGSIMYPEYYNEQCDCVETGDYILPTYDAPKQQHVESSGAVATRIKSSMILACPHVIIDPSHYRFDGTCRCTDPEHTIMAEWGYKWDGQMWTGD